VAKSANPDPTEKDPVGSPYCTDPNCQSCKELREMQEATRLGKPLPK